MERCGLLHRWTVTACVAGLTLWTVGCGGASGDGSQAAGPQAPAEVAVVLPKTNPADTVKEFLEAYKKGDPAKAESLLTKKALEETKRVELEVAPEGIETSHYEVGEYEIHEDGAQVFSVWTETDDKGGQKTDKIVWLLLPDEGQWRIAGMAMTVFEGEPPLILNFEEPEEMFRKQELLAQEIARREAIKSGLPGVAPPTGATPATEAAPGTTVPVTAAVPANPAAPAPSGFFPPANSASAAPTNRTSAGNNPASAPIP